MERLHKNLAHQARKLGSLSEPLTCIEILGAIAIECTACGRNKAGNCSTT
jgi:hypothetical protein